MNLDAECFGKHLPHKRIKLEINLDSVHMYNLFKTSKSQYSNGFS